VGGQLTPALLEASEVTKRFGATLALDGVSLAVEGGSVHALVGENGAGKSTLGKVLAGAVRPDAGTLLFDGERVEARSPKDALARGISMVAQELAIAPDLSVLDNVFLGMERDGGGFRAARGARARRFEALSSALGFELDPGATAGKLRLADQQKIEILRVLAKDSRVIIMDEPTAALTPSEAEGLLEVTGKLRADGRTVIYVSHFLDQVLEVSDQVTVLKDGRVVRTTRAADVTADSLIESMLGRPLERTFPKKRLVPPDARVVLEARGLRVGDAPPVDLVVRAGEIVCLTGLVGSGRSELARAVYGADRRRGQVFVDGGPIRHTSPRAAIDMGVTMIPESRKSQGLLLERSTAENAALIHLAEHARFGVLRRTELNERVDRSLARVDVRGGASAPAVTLSGGNQQKLLFARALLHTPKALIADEPTRGVDVGAKLAIYELLVDLAAGGMAVLLISSELEEVLGLAHRIVVLSRGRIVAELPHDATHDEVMGAAFDSPRPVGAG
jgi:ABC-type sugar transport system ATPase subunit